MYIRNSAKALVIEDGKVLLNKCTTYNNQLYYTLPGGTQNQYETMEEAAIRQCREETGYTIGIDDFIAIYEEINTADLFKTYFSTYTHRIFTVFKAHLLEDVRQQPIELDKDQVSSVWIDIDDLQTIPLVPAKIKSHIKQMIENDESLYLGSERTENNKLFG